MVQYMLNTLDISCFLFQKSVLIYVSVFVLLEGPNRHRYVTHLKRLDWLLQLVFLQLHLNFRLNLIFRAYYSRPKRCLHIPKLALYMKDKCFSIALRSSSNLSFLMMFILSKLWLSCIRYGIAMYHFLTAVNLDVCSQRQVILEHRSCRVKGGGLSQFCEI